MTPDLFSLPPERIRRDPAPALPGFKERGGTSEEAARAIRSRVATLRDNVLELLRTGAELTADEIAERLKETPLAIRPRVTELGNLNLIEKTGARRKNVSGMGAAVWRACGGRG